MRGETKSASRSVCFNQISITFTDGSRLPKVFDNNRVSVDKKSLFFGNNANYKVNWRDVEDMEVGEESLKVVDGKNQRICECYGVTTKSWEEWMAFRKMVEKTRAKREGKQSGNSPTKGGTGARKAPVRRRAYGRRRQLLPSSRTTTFWPGDDDDDDGGDYDYGHHRGALQTRDEEMNQDDEGEDEKLVVALPEEDDDGDAPALDQEAEEELEDPFDIAEKKKFETKTPVLKKMQGRSRLRKRFSSANDTMEEDSDDDFETTDNMTSLSPNQRVVTPVESTTVVEEEEDEATAEEDTHPPTPKNQMKLHSFFSKAHKADTEKPKPVSTPATKSPFKKDRNRIEVKKTFSSNQTSLQSPPRTQQRMFTPKEKYDMNFSPPSSPVNSRIGIATRLDEPPTTSRKQKFSRPFAWSSLDKNSDTEEADSLERITPIKTSSTYSPSSKGKRPRLNDNDSMFMSSNKRASIGGINRYGMNNRRLPMTTPYRENITASEEPYKGFRNMGNTCYLNASLQMLYTSKDFVTAIEGKGGDLVRSITSAKALLDNTAKPGAASAKSVKMAMDAITDKFLGFEQRDAHEFLGDLIDNIHEEIVGKKKEVTQSGDADAEPTSETDLTQTDLKESEEGSEEAQAIVDKSNVAKEAVAPTSPSVPGTSQLDLAKESGDVTVSIDPAKAESEQACQTTNPADRTGSDVKDEGLRPPTDDYFRCDVEVCLTCNSCGYSRTKKEFYRHLSLDIEHHEDENSEGVEQSVQKSLDLFFQPEEREIKCEKCEEGTTASQTLRLLNRPKALLLHLKRFIFEERIPVTAPPTSSDKDKENQPDDSEAPQQQVEIIFRKNKAPVAISEHVSLKKLYGESNKEGRTEHAGVYSVKSLVYHIGARASSGHYTADALRTSVKKDSKSPDQSVGESADSNTSEAVAKTEWVSFDDSRTTLTTLHDILESKQRQKTAYMLLYTMD